MTSIGRRLTWFAVVGVLAVEAIGAAVRVERERALLEDELVRDLDGLARSIAVAAADAWRVGGEAEARARFAAIQASEVHFDLAWFDEHDLPSGIDVDHKSALASGDPVATARVSAYHEGDTSLSVLAPVLVDNRLAAVVRAEGRFDEQEAYLRTSLFHAVASAVLTSLVLALILALGARTLVIRPVARLARAAERIGTGDLSSPVPAERSDEIGELARVIDAMRGGLRTALQRAADEAHARGEAEERAHAEKERSDQLARQLRHANRLATIGTLASTVLHELGAPLQVIGGRARMIADAPHDAGKVAEWARVIQEKSEQMTRMSRALLDFARKSGEPSSSPMPASGEARAGATSLGEALDPVLVLIAPLARHARVDIDVAPGALAARFPLTVQELGQVLTNLAQNAIHAMPNGGTLRFSVTGGGAVASPSPAPAEPDAGPPPKTAPSGRFAVIPGEPASSDGGAGIALVVADTGVGMDRETLAHVFQPFFTTKPAGQGTGLGTSVVRRIVEEVGGSIDVDSAVGAGTTFTLRFPAASASKTSVTAPTRRVVT